MGALTPEDYHYLLNVILERDKLICLFGMANEAMNKYDRVNDGLVSDIVKQTVKVVPKAWDCIKAGGYWGAAGGAAGTSLPFFGTSIGAAGGFAGGCLLGVAAGEDPSFGPLEPW